MAPAGGGGAHVGPYIENLSDGDIDTFGPRGNGAFDFAGYENAVDDYMKGQLLEDWEVITEPLSFIFHVRPGIYWTGKTVNPGVMEKREFTAYDIESAMQRFQNNDRVGVRIGWVDTITATDKYTVEITMHEFHAAWMYLTCFGYVSKKLSPETVEAGPSDWRNHCGTGPFILTDYTAGTALTFERNPDYWGTTTIDGKEYQLPFVDKWIVPIIIDESTRMAALRTGQLDVVSRARLRFRDSLKSTCPDLNQLAGMHSSPYEIYCHFDDTETGTWPFTDLKVRRALSMAIDRESLIKSVFTEGVIHNYPIYYNMPTTLYTPLEDLPEAVQEQYEYNPEKAKQLLEEALGPPGDDGFFFKTTMECLARDEPQDVASLLVSYWADVGIDCELDVREQAAHSAAFYNRDYTQLLVTASHNVHFPYWNLATEELPGQVYNVSGRENPAIIELVSGAVKDPDAARRDAAIKAASIMMLEDCDVIEVATGAYDHWWWPWLKNYYGEMDSCYYCVRPMAARIWIDEDLKDEMGY